MIVVGILISMASVSASDVDNSTSSDGDSILSAPDDVVDIYVDCSASDGNGSQEKPYSNIKSAMDVIENGKTTNIHIASGVYNTSENYGFSLNNGYNISFIGENKENTIIQLDSSSFITDTSSTNILSFSNLKFEKGDLGWNYAIRASGSCNIDNCIFENFKVESNLVYACNPNIKSTKFKNISGRGATLTVDYEYGGTMYPAYISNCTFENCGEGTSRIVNIATKSYIDNCTFSNCNPNMGTIYVGQETYVSNTTFKDCHANMQGAAIYVSEDLYILENVNIINCTSPEDDGIYTSFLKYIKSKINITFMDNDTVYSNSAHPVIYATVTDEYGHSITSILGVLIKNDDTSISLSDFTVNGKFSSPVSDLNGTYTVTYDIDSFSSTNCTVLDGILIVDPMENIDVYVANDGSDEDGNGTIENPYATIEKGLEAASDAINGNLHIKSGNYNLSSIQWSSSGNLVIDSYGDVNPVIDALGSNSLINVFSSGSITLSNLDFVNFAASSSGFINSWGPNIIIDGCNFYNASSFGNGYLIVTWSGACLNITNSKLILNKSNIAILRPISSSIYINNSQFVNNGGNLIEANNGNDNLIIENSIFDGGPIPGISCTNIDISNSKFINNARIELGYCNVCNIINSTFENNTILNNDGGSLYVRASNAKLRIVDSRFINSQARNGAAIYFQPNVICEAYLENNTAINCVADTDNFIYAQGVANSVRFTSDIYLTFLNNSTLSIDSIQLPLSAVLTDDNGNTISGPTVSFTIDGNVVSSSNTLINGSADVKVKYYVNGTAVVSGSTSIRTYNLIVKTGTINATPLENIDVYVATDGNDETGDGSQENPYATLEKALEVASTSFNSNVYVKSGKYNLTALQDFNTVGGLLSIIGYDGEVEIDMMNTIGFARISTENSNVLISNIKFINGYGNIESNSGIISSRGNLTITNCTFENNKGYYTTIYSNSLKVISSSFTNNNPRYTYDSSDIYAKYSEIKDSTFNTGSNIPNVYVTSGSLIDNCTFYNGRVYISGGEIIVNNSNFIDNTGRAIDINGRNALVNVTNSKFINNAGLNDRVSIYHNGAGLYLENNTVTDSQSPFYVYASNHQISHVDVIVGGNQTKDIEAFILPMTAVVVDDNGNKIQLASINFYLNGELSGSKTFSNGEATYTYSNLNGVYVFSADSPYLSDYTVKTSTLNITPKLYMDLYVDVDGSDEEGDGSQEHPYATIGHAVANAGALESVIHVGDGVFNPDSSLAISSSGGKISIIGSGNTIIDLKKERRFIDSISTDSIVLLKDLSIINGYYAGMGGTIYNSGNLTIDNVLFINSTATSAGGTIVNWGNYAESYVLNSKFINSTASMAGAILNYNGYLYLKNNTAENVIATSGTGNYVYTLGTVDGVILTFNDNATEEITGSSVTLRATVSDDNGNPISGMNVPISFTLNGTNVATANLQIDVATATINVKLNGDYVLGGTLGTAENNVVKTAILKFTNSDVLNEAWVSETGDDNNNGSADAPFKTVSKALSVLPTIGGTVHFVGDSYDLPATITVSGFNDLTFTSEESTLIHSSDYQLFNVLSGSSVTLSNLNITGSYNSRSESTAGLIRSAGKLYVDNCNIVNNKFLSAGSNGLIFYNNGGSLVINNTLFANNDLGSKSNGYTYGSGVYSTGTFSMYNSVVENNNITRFDLYSSSNSFIYSTSAMEINNCNFTNIGMEKQGTSLVNYGFIYNSAVNSKIVDCNFVNFTGYGVIYAYSGNLLVDNCKFINFTMSISANNMALAIYTLRSSVDVYNSLFKNISLSTSSVIGGAMGNTGYEYNIVNNTFDDNTLSIILNLGYDSLVTGNKFINNNYSSDCIKMTNCILTAFNNTFDNNVGKLEVYTLDNSEAKITGSTYTVVFSDNSTYEINGNSFTVNATLKDADGNYISTPITFKLNETAIGEATPNNGIATLPVKQTFNGTYVLSGDVEGIYDSNSLIRLNSIYTINAIENVVIYVDVFGSDVNGDGSQDKPYKTLERALQDANGINNTIYLLPGTYDASSNSNLNVAMAPGSSLSIIGLNQGLDEVIFDFENTDANFIEFTGNPDASFALSNVKFVNINSMSFIQSVIPINLDNVSVSDSSVQIFITCDIVNMTGCEFENVTGTYINSNTGTSSLTNYNIVNSSFKNNIFSVGLLNGLMKLNVVSSVFINNEASVGGVLYGPWNNGNYNFTNCVIINNTRNGAPNFAFGSGKLDINDNWWGYNTDIASIYSLISGSLTVSLDSWVVAEVTCENITVAENNTIDVKFISSNGNQLTNSVPARLVELILGENIDTYDLADNVATISYVPENVGELTVKVDDQVFTFDVVKGNLEVMAEDEIDYSPAIDYALGLVSGDKLADNITFTITVGGVEFVNVTTDEEGIVILDLSGFETGDYEVTYDIPESPLYNAASGSYTLTINKGEPEISIDEVTDGSIVISIPEDIVAEDLVAFIDGEEYEVLINDNIATVDISDLKPGKYTAVITYPGDDNYEDVTIVDTIEIPKEDAYWDVDIDDDVITFELPEDATGYLLVDVNGTGYYAPVEDGVAILEVTGLEPGSYDAIITYSGDDTYNSIETTGVITVPEVEPLDPELEVSADGTEVTISLNENATGYVVVSVDDQDLFFNYEGDSIVVDLSDLEPGNYTVEVTYSGDEFFASDSASAEIEVPEVEPLDPELEVIVGDAVVVISLNENATGYVVVSVDDEDLFFNYEGEPIVVDLSDLEPGNYTVEVTYSGDEFFASDSASAEIEVPEVEPLDPELDVTVNGTVVTVSLNENATGYVVVGIVGDMDMFFEYDGEPIDVDFDGLQPGDYTVEVFYSGDDVFAEANATATVVIPEVEPLDPELEAFAEGSDVIITLNEDATGMVLVGLDDVVLFFPAVGEPIVVDLSFLLPGNYTVAVKYLGDEVFAPANATVTVTIPEDEKKDAGLKASVNGTELTVSLNKNATGYVLAGVEGGLLFYEYEGKDIVVDLSYLEAGNYTIIVLYSGDEAFYPGETSASVTIPEEPVVEPKDPNLKATAANATITVSVDKDATGNVLVDVDGQGYYAPVKDGQAVINAIGLDEGKYDAVVTYVGDDIFAPANATVSITVPKKEDPTPEPVDPKANISISEDGVEIALPEDATGYLLVDVDGTGYYTTVEDGKASFDLPELALGNHTVTVTYTGDKKYDSANATKTVEVEGPVETIISENLTKVEKSPDRFEATFTDAQGNALANTDVKFVISGNTYTRTTDANGKAGMNINLPAGNYSVTIINPVTNETKVNTITVLPRLEGNDLTKYFKNASQFYVKVFDDNGNPVKAGEVVTFNINGVFYNRTTDDNGMAKLSINLIDGDYVITSEYKGCKIANNIKVLPILTAKDLTKQYGKSGAFEATLVDGQGKPYANQQVEFNINGVFYKRTTGSNGVAKLNINLQAGKYIVTSSYNGFNIANTVTVTA